MSTKITPTYLGNVVVKGITIKETSTIPFEVDALGVWTAIKIVASEAIAMKAIYTEVTSSKTSSSTEGIRAEAIGNAASGTAAIRGGNFKANMNASKQAALIEGVLAHASYAAGSITATEVKGLGVLISQGASLTVTDLYGIHVNEQTRGDETIAGDDALICLENEAVGGNGREVAAGILLKGTNLGGGTKALTVLLDATGASLSVSETDMVTLIAFQDDQGTTHYIKYDRSGDALVISETAP